MPLVNPPSPSGAPGSHAPAAAHDDSSRTAVLAASALVHGLSCDEFATMGRTAARHQFERDDIFYMQGQQVHSVMMIENGAAKLTQVSRDGEELTLWVCGKGDPVSIPAGGSSCSAHSCTARTLTPCTVLRWDRALLDQIPQVRRNLDSIVSSRLQELERRFCEMTSGSVSRRLAYTLMHVLPTVGRQQPDGIHIPLTREELARISALSMFTVSRIISKWSLQELVIARREAVVIPHPERLAALCRPTPEIGALVQ